MIRSDHSSNCSIKPSSRHLSSFFSRVKPSNFTFVTPIRLKNSSELIIFNDSRVFSTGVDCTSLELLSTPRPSRSAVPSLLLLVGGAGGRAYVGPEFFLIRLLLRLIAELIGGGAELVLSPGLLATPPLGGVDGAGLVNAPLWRTTPTLTTLFLVKTSTIC